MNKRITFTKQGTDKNIVLEIAGASLLNVIEAKDLPVDARRCGSKAYWTYWTCTGAEAGANPGDEGRQITVYGSGMICWNGEYTTGNKFGIRPVLEYAPLDIEPEGLKPWTSLANGCNEFYVIPGNKLLLKDVAAVCQYAEGSSPVSVSYEDSLAKRAVDAWASVNGYIDPAADAPISGKLKIRSGEFENLCDSGMNLTEYLKVRYSDNSGSGCIYLAESGDISVAKAGREYDRVYGDTVDAVWEDVLKREIISQLGITLSDLMTALAVSSSLAYGRFVKDEEAQAAFESVQVGDIVECFDDCDERKMLVTSIKDDPAEACADNPKGRKLYGTDISDGNIGTVYPGNFLGVRPAPSTWKELYDIVEEAYMSDSVELSTGYFDIRVKMPKRDILTAWSRLAQDINGDIVVRKEGGKTFFASDDGFIPEDEYREGYEGFAGEFLDSFKDDRFHRYIPDDADDKDAEDLGEEVSFIY